MKIEEWKNGIDAWTKIKTQANIDIEQADLYIKAIEDKMKTLEVK